MVARYLRVAKITVYAGCLIPALVWAYNLFKPRERAEGLDLWLKLVALVGLAGLAYLAVSYLPKRFRRTIEALSYRQKRFLARISDSWVGAAIFVSAGVSLVLELAMIRWQGSVFELFSLYKNFGLLACFAGLGLGYTLSSRRQVPLLLSAPLLAWQMLLLIFTRYGPTGWNVGILRSTPVLEQLNMGVSVANTLHEYVAVTLLLSVTFMLTALAFVPIGQMCGALMTRRPKLRAYGLNLLGSLAGVLLFFGFSLLWTPPLVWFAVCFAALLAFQTFDRRMLVFGSACSLLAVIALAWPVNFPWSRTYSPYQLLELGPGREGFCKVRAGGYYYQKIYDLSASAEALAAVADRPAVAQYYELPYRIAGEPGRVAIVGAGTGNDVAAALRMGAEQVDAIEIDPVILQYGQLYHPERPYQHASVNGIVNDARTHLRQTDRSYDMIVYGLLDSHTLLSHGSSVRLDSFVYTVEAFREARARLADDGVLCLSFCVLSEEMGKKFYLMLKEAFDGQAPLCIGPPHRGWVAFVQRKSGAVTAPEGLLAEANLEDITARYADPALQADVSTDDWPFMYMPRRAYPASYVAVVALILVLSLALTRTLSRATPGLGHSVFFLLGAGFMLVETKSITELGLTFGNTWQVIGIVIAGILCMAFVANCLVQWLGIRGLTVPYLLLLASLGLGLVIAREGGFASTAWGQVLALLILTCPLFFSGIIFSTALRHCQDITGAMAANLVGAMCGGLLEYNSMYFGFGFLYWVAMGLYGVAFAVALWPRLAGTAARFGQPIGVRHARA